MNMSSEKTRNLIGYKRRTPLKFLENAKKNKYINLIIVDIRSSYSSKRYDEALNMKIPGDNPRKQIKKKWMSTEISIIGSISRDGNSVVFHF